MNRDQAKKCYLVALATLLLVACDAAQRVTESMGSRAGDPPFSVDEKLLAEALNCDPLEGLNTEPLLLVHGTFTNAIEQYDTGYRTFLRDRGFATCTVTYPDRGLGDQQVSAEYVAYAIQAIAQRSGRKVDVVGHSQGAVLPRWAVRWWPSARSEVDDLILLAGPNHGTVVADANVLGLPFSASTWQFRTDSQFVRALNSGDETPGNIDYTSIYTLTDELVQPVFPEPAAALDFGREEANTVNILMQDVCPGRLVDHVSIGFLDAWVAEILLDAALNPGPADASRVPNAVCQMPQTAQGQDAPAQFAPALQYSMAQGAPDFHAVDSEPPLMPYARGD